MARIDEVARARNAKVAKVSLINSLVNEITEALLEMGGSAHRDTVIDRVAVRRGIARVSDGLKVQLLDAFEQHRVRAGLESRQPLLHLPFGEGSRRWSLTPDGRQFVQPCSSFELGEQGLQPTLNSVASV